MSEVILNILNTPLPYGNELWSFVKSLTTNYFWADFILVAIIPMVWFYVYGLVFYLIDNYTSENFKYKYKVQNNIRITPAQYWDVLTVSLWNWIVLALPYLLLVCKINEYRYEKNNRQEPAIPTVGLFFRDFVVFAVIEEFMFYFSHRALHWPSFYASIHKFHHKFTAPCAIAAVYAQPTEHMISNVIPVSVGPLLMKSHPISVMIWGVFALFNTMTVHSGYDFSSFIVFPSPYFHDWHHEKFNENFGAAQLLDFVFGTNKNFLETIAKGEMYVPRKKYSNKEK
jgi:sterol desaturase/sphingolipid hydroxylase (fatty acid hydroxylase superfamily)